MKRNLVRTALYTLPLALCLAAPAVAQRHAPASPPARFVNVGQDSPTPVDPSNPANAFDFVGELHNQGLDYVVANKDRLGADPELWELRIGQLTSEFLCANEAQISQMFAQVPPGTLPDDCSMADDEVFFVAQIQALQDDASTLGYAAYIDSVKQIESSILALPMSTREKTLRLAACSVARHSGAYWYTQTRLAVCDWATPPFEPPAHLSISWKKVAKADVKGAVGGLVKGIFVPPLTGASVVGGALAASAVELVDQAWQ